MTHNKTSTSEFYGNSSCILFKNLFRRDATTVIYLRKSLCIRNKKRRCEYNVTFYDYKNIA